MIVVNEYISNNRRMVLQPYNDTWRALRRFLHGQLHDKFAATYEPVQDQEAKALAFSILEDPDEYANHLQLFSSNVSRCRATPQNIGNAEQVEHAEGHPSDSVAFSRQVILQVAYNRRARNAQDEVIQGMIHSIETWSLSALPGAHLVADFPILE